MDGGKVAPDDDAKSWQYEKITGLSDEQVKQYTRLGNRKDYPQKRKTP